MSSWRRAFGACARQDAGIHWLFRLWKRTFVTFRSRSGSLDNLQRCNRSFRSRLQSSWILKLQNYLSFFFFSSSDSIELLKLSHRDPGGSFSAVPCGYFSFCRIYGYLKHAWRGELLNEVNFFRRPSIQLSLSSFWTSLPSL